MPVDYSTFAQIKLNMPEGVTPLSHDIYTLHMAILWICVVIGIGVFGVMLYSIIYHRKSIGHKAVPFHEHFYVEISWTIIPFLILILMAVPATAVLRKMNDTDKEDLTIKVTGYQWKWQYEYLGKNIKFFSNMNTPLDQINGKAPKEIHYLESVDKPVVIPVHKKVRFLMTSNDVIHSWWVPELGVKRDALPGFINEAWARVNRAGTYYGHCTELCGVNHAYMPIVVVALSEKDFAAWLTKQTSGEKEDTSELTKQWSIDELKTQGEKIYMTICAACHQPTGMGLPPTFPALNKSPTVNGPVEAHINTVMNGRPGTAMQAFKNQLSDKDIAAVITYERNAWDNHTGTVVQPITIKAARDGKTEAEELAILKAKPQNAPATPQPGTQTTTGKISKTTNTTPKTTLPPKPLLQPNVTPQAGSPKS